MMTGPGQEYDRRSDSLDWSASVGRYAESLIRPLSPTIFILRNVRRAQACVCVKLEVLLVFYSRKTS